MRQLKSTETALDYLRKQKLSLIKVRNDVYNVLTSIDKNMVDLQDLERAIEQVDDEARLYKTKVFNSAEKRVRDAERREQRALERLKGEEIVLSEEEIFNLNVASTTSIIETIINHSVLGFESRTGLPLAFYSVIFPAVYDHLPIKGEGEEYFIQEAPENLIEIIKDLKVEIARLERDYGVSFTKSRNWEASKEDIRTTVNTYILERLYLGSGISFEDVEPLSWETMMDWNTHENLRMQEFPYVFDCHRIALSLKDTVGEMNGLNRMGKHLAALHE